MVLKYCRRILLLLSLLAYATSISAQKLIEYEAGMGSRDPGDPDVWILYQRVKAMHEGMTLYADSALLNTVQNDFTAYRSIKIELSDTTTIFGDRLYYDGNSRVVDIWGDTVVFVDGGTVLKTDRLTFDRNTNIAYYERWGHSTNREDTLDSRIGRYNADLKIFYIYLDVVLHDSSSCLTTDTLIYNTQTEVANFVSPTHIVSDSSTIYSELGFYDSRNHYAVSYLNSHVRSGVKNLSCDTLHYYEGPSYGKAFGHVVIFDSLNNITCTGNYGESNQEARFSFVTDSALVVFVDDGDSLFLHADTVYTTNNENKEFETVRANYHVKVFRRDVQGMCDSAFYSVPDSLIQLYYSPIVWYDSFQCTADTMDLYVDSNGLRLVYLKGGAMTAERLDQDKFNQVKGKRANVYFKEGEPDYADVLGSAQMVYYLTEEDSAGRQRLIGVNVGVGSDMRIYFNDRQPDKVTTYGNPDMTVYPYAQLPSDKRELQGFEWYMTQRPLQPMDVFKTTDKVAQKAPLAKDLK